jgi:hypothetical protein
MDTAPEINTLKRGRPPGRMLSSIASTRRSLARLLAQVESRQGEMYDLDDLDKLSRIHDRLSRLIVAERRAKRSDKLLSAIRKLTDTLARGQPADMATARVLQALAVERGGED